MEINTERLKLREIIQQDFQAIHEYASDPEAVKYMPFGPNTKEETQEFINRNLKRQKENPRTDYGLGIILKHEDRLIGACGIHDISEIQTSIGYILNRRYWGHGYATEVAKALVDYVFSELGVHRVYASCDPQNHASIRVLEKVGMSLEGRLRENMIIHGEYRDSLIFGLLNNEWKINNP
ncbi:MAG: GNAT family N-acetyltransferase [Promethearchaeota archaeon]|jgi:RimJ/RimL family protein N-acetyltransferase